MKITNLFSLAALLCLLVSCHEEPITLDSQTDDQPTELLPDNKQSSLGKTAASYFPANTWSSGTLPNSGSYDSRIVSPQNLKFTSGQLQGPKIVVSNNPEAFYSDGWLMQTSNKGRGSSTYKLSNGKIILYLFHYNRSSNRGGKYIHVLATNPGNSTMRITAKGKAYTSASKPLPAGQPGTGPSFAVADDWLRNRLTTKNSGSIGRYGAYEVAKIYVPYDKFVDGRYEISITGEALFYVVATSNGNTTTAINLSQNTAASGAIARPGSNAFGRSAGIYQQSEFNGTYNVDLPSGTGHIGFCFNTTSKFDNNFQEQSPSAVMRLSDSSPRHYGDYGMEFYQRFSIRNTSSRTRRVRFYVASNNHAQNSGVRSNQLTYNGSVKLNGAIKTLWTRGDNPKIRLAEWNIPANSTFNATLEGYFPGLLTVGQQIILETTN